MPSPIMPPGVVYHPAQIKAYDVEVHGFNGDKVPAYVARPSEEGIFPGLVLVHGVHGYEEHMKDVARRFAAVGYAADSPRLVQSQRKALRGRRIGHGERAGMAGQPSERPGQRRPRGRKEFPPVQRFRKSADWASRVLLWRKGGPWCSPATRPDWTPSSTFTPMDSSSPPKSIPPPLQRWSKTSVARCWDCLATKIPTPRRTTWNGWESSYPGTGRSSRRWVTRGRVTLSFPTPERATILKRLTWPGTMP